MWKRENRCRRAREGQGRAWEEGAEEAKEKRFKAKVRCYQVCGDSKGPGEQSKDKLGWKPGAANLPEGECELSF